MAADLPEAEFAAMIGVRAEQLPDLEREGLPTVGKAKAKRYPVPRAISWYIDYSVARRVGGLPPRVNQADLASLIGISRRQVTNLVEGGKLSSLIEKGKRLYQLPTVVHEFIKYREEIAKGASKEAINPLDAARLRKLTAEAEQAEMVLLKTRGEQLDRVTAQRALVEILQALRGQLTQVANRHDKKFVQLPTAAKARQALRLIMNAELVRLGAVVAAVGRRIQVVAEDVSPEEEAAAGEEPGAPPAPASEDDAPEATP